MAWHEYEKELTKRGYTPDITTGIKPAFEFAVKAHASEKRKSGEPYIIHPIAVSLYVADLKLDTDTIAAALLHDVIENQNIPIKTIRSEFGANISFLVEAVTKVDKVRYRGIERAVESLRKMFLAFAEDIRVVIIKLMDRLHNMETLEFHTPEKQKRIALETLELFAPLADRLGMWEIKAKLEDLSFPYVYPEEYKWLKSHIEHPRKDGETYLEKLKPEVEAELKKENITPLRITHRTKHLYSIWKKLVKYEMNFDRVLDIVAMRIVLSTVEDCYRVLGVLHKLWKPMPGRIKDFIALPKPNGYQSLHTTVFGPDKKIVDFQIRTDEMDREAEYGIAAHWAYEAAGKKIKTPPQADKKLAWVHDVQKWYQDHKSGSLHQPADEMLSAFKIDFFKDRIFVLTPKGDVIDLPDGSSPVDFAYHVHSEIGDHMAGAKVNNKMVPFSHPLKSGVTVEILTQKNKKPTIDWLDIAKTSLAKNRIRSYLRNKGITETPKKLKQMLEATITAKDRVGLLKDYSGALAKLKIDIVDVKIDTKNKAYSKYSKTTFYFASPEHIPLAKILALLKQVSGVENVSIKEVR